MGEAMPVDYFGKWFNANGFDFTGLINADFVQPVRILYQNQHYVSATKLLLIAIDSVSFIEFGEIKENSFIKWLDAYADFSEMEITSIELWEHRNALLHMSSLTSRKIKKGNVRMLVGYLGEVPSEVTLNNSDVGYYKIRDLIMVVANAFAQWCQTYDIDRNKINDFVERYDLIASDDRMLKIRLG